MNRDKEIQEIRYNHLNLPTKISFTSNREISYIYDASGVKTNKEVNDGTQINTTAYRDGFQYSNNSLEFFPTAEGYVKTTRQSSGYDFNYVFNHTDHLGNIRLRYTQHPETGATEILQEDHYYPFGLKHEGYNNEHFVFSLESNDGITLVPATLTVGDSYKFKFQNQELQDELGLNWYSFKWRNYMPDIGRFFNPDPLSEQYAYQSHYNFSENRVIDGRELEGLEYVSVHHYANGAVSKTEYYKMSNSQIKRLGGTTAGVHNSVPYGAGGKGIAHYYYNDAGDRTSTHWEQRQTGGTSDFAYHGLYSGPGSITYDGINGSENYNFDAQPIDYADAIAKRHDMDYAAAAGENYAGYLEDVRTLQADRDMVQRIDDFTNPFKSVKGIETPVRTSYSTEMDFSMLGQRVLINALATYKQWKVDNKLGNDNLYKDNREAFGKAHPATAKILDQLPD